MKSESVMETLNCVVLFFTFQVCSSGNFSSDPPPVCTVSQSFGLDLSKLCENILGFRHRHAYNALYSSPGISFSSVKLCFFGFPNTVVFLRGTEGGRGVGGRVVSLGSAEGAGRGHVNGKA